jgi:UPF0755 protein
MVHVKRVTDLVSNRIAAVRACCAADRPAIRCALVVTPLLLLLLTMALLSSPRFFVEPEVVDVYIGNGLSSRQIGVVLKEAGLVWSADLFAVVSRIRGVHTSLKSGHYRLLSNAPLVAVIDRLARGEVHQIKITIPEGYGIEQIAALLQSSGVADARQFAERAHSSASEYSDLLGFVPPTGSLEGYLFPDTYLVSEGLPVGQLISVMVRRFCEKALPVLEGASRSGLTPHELVTLASIIEREAALDSERPLVSSVFYNRIKSNTALESCATVQYALGNPSKELTLTDLAFESPYNTYLHKGLPPGPIANPGLPSLLAAVNPADTQFMFFVADGLGGHVFTTRYQEHLAATEQLRRLRGD